MVAPTSKAWKPGTAPGTLSAPVVRVDAVRITLSCHTRERVHEATPASTEAITRVRQQGGVLWVDVVGLHDLTVLQHLGAEFGLHPLALEDAVATDVRPKQEPYEGTHFVVLRHFFHRGRLESEQISLFLGTGFVVSLREVETDVFEPVRERLRFDNSRLRQRGADYLLYALIDAVIDQLFPVLEIYEHRVQSLEARLLRSTESEIAADLMAIKKDLVVLRRWIVPLRDIASGLERQSEGLIDASTCVYLRDCSDHAAEAIDIVETETHVANDLMQFYQSSLGNRTNQVMKVLTVMAAIFVPLTFIVGIYGMNFAHMPELGWRYGYPAVWGLMAATVVGLLALFRCKKWL